MQTDEIIRSIELKARGGTWRFSHVSLFLLLKFSKQTQAPSVMFSNFFLIRYEL